MATPVKPIGHFPHSMVPNAKLKFAEKMSRSMIIPKMSASYAMIESTVSNSSQMRKIVSTNHQMSQSTAPSVGGFVIAASSDADAENLMEQSQIISKMMETSELSKQTRPTAFDCSSNGSRETASSTTVANTSSSNISLPSQLAQELQQSRHELNSITQRIQQPNSLSSNYSLRSQQSMLAPVPELSTPGTNAASPNSTPSNDMMTRSRLFQEFANKKQMQQPVGMFNGHNCVYQRIE
jgi:hypothetical protein